MPHARRRSGRGALPLMLAAVAACGGRPGRIPAPPPPVPAEQVAVSVYLVGDAGAPAPGFEPVLAALGRDLAAAPAAAWVVFLGDNLYPAGLPDSTHSFRAEAERRLLAQIRTVGDAGARGVFVPGNHDWVRGADEGWDAIRRQARFVETHGGGRLELLPRHGCPGPAVRDVGDRVRVVFLDTQWWLHGGPKPTEPASPCPAADSEAEVTDSLRTLVGTAGRRVVLVTAHHPPASGGVHGGSFGLRHHLFPLTEIRPWLWIPLPVIGSLYPLARMAGVSNQDLSGSRYRAMRDSLVAAMHGGRLVIFAGGHDHNLQVLADSLPHYVLVSGSGIYGHTSRVSWRATTRFAAQAAGYMRLDVAHDGRVRLSVLIVDETGAAREAFGEWLE